MKILIHAINGVGLGHLVRSLEIAKSINTLRKDIEVVFVTNSGFPDMIKSNNYRFYKLKNDTFDVLKRKISYEKYLTENTVEMKIIVKKEKPDMMIFDSELNDDLIDFCRLESVKTVYVLRNKSDSYFSWLIDEGCLEKVDMILLPHSKEDINPEHLMKLNEFHNVCFSGPIIKGVDNAVKKKIGKKGELNILVTFSAGADIEYNSRIFSKVSDFLKYLKENKMKIKGVDINVKMITGPYYEEGSCNLCGFKHQKFIDNIFLEMNKSDIVVSAAGYNTVNEIIYTKTPALLIPIITKQDDQFSRAKILSDKGCVKLVDGKIQDLIVEIITSNKLCDMKNSFPELKAGNTKAAKMIIELLDTSREPVEGMQLNLLRNKVGILRSNWLPVSERFIFDEVTGLDFYEPYVFCVNREGNWHDRSNCKIKVFHDDKYNELWIKEYPFIKNRQMRLYQDFISECVDEIRNENIKLLHAEFMTDALFFLPVKKATDLPLVVSVRGYDLYASDNIDYRPLFDNASVFLTRSEKMKNNLINRGCDADKIIVQHSGIRQACAGNYGGRNNSKEINILLVGRFVEKKGTCFGIDLFNHICREYKEIGTNFNLNIIGDGILKKEVEEKVRESPFTDRIKLFRALANDKVVEEMKKNDILLHPSVTAKNSDQEGIPNAVMEAMYHGLTVLASDNGSIPELVENDVTGFIFKEGNISEALSKLKDILGKMAENDTSLDEIRSNAFKKVKDEFDIKKQTKMLEMIYSSFVVNNNSNDFSDYFANYESIKQKDVPSYFRVDIHPTSGCDNNCLMCDNWKNDKDQQIPEERIRMLLEELKEKGVNEVRFHGQEPTLFEGLPSLISYAKELGFFVGLKTNANKLTEDYCRKIACLDKLYLSIDSPDEKIHNKLRGNASSFKSNLDAIKFMKNVSENVVIELNSVLTNINYKSLVDMPLLAAEHGVDKVSFVSLNDKNKKNVKERLLDVGQLEEFYTSIVPEIVKNSVMLGVGFDFSPFFTELVSETPEKIYYELKYNSEKYKDEIVNFSELKYGKKFYEKYGCYGPLDHMTINYDGNAYSCCVADRVEDNAVGNVMDSSFIDVWNSKKYHSIRGNTLRTNGRCCPFYEQCGSNLGTRKALSDKISMLHKDDEKNALKKLIGMHDFYLHDSAFIEKKVETKLSNALAYAAENIPFYKLMVNKPGVAESSAVLSLLNLEQFDILEKKDVRDNIYKGMINPDYADDPGLTLDRTSGSMDDTVPFAYLRGFDRYLKMIYPFTVNSEWKWGQRYLVFSTLHCSRDRCSNDDLPMYVNREKIPTSENIFDDYVALSEGYSLIKKNNLSLLHADPFYLAALARFINNKNNNNGADNIKLKGISSTYELLIPTVKRYLEKTFECNVFNSYGCSEFGSIAFSCEKGNMHVFEDSVFVEIMDKGKYHDSDVGELVVTSLDNKAMPLIRYRTGDLGKLVPGKCSCGRNNKMLEVFGRKTSCLKLSGKLYTESDVAKLMDIKGVLLYQLMVDILGADCGLNIDVIMTDEMNGLKDGIVKEINARFAEAIKNKSESMININFVNSIKPEISGKFKTIKLKR